MIARNQRCHIKTQRCHIENTIEIRSKLKGVINFSILKNLSSNLYDTFKKRVINTRNICYYTIDFGEGVVRFMTPYDTFTTPFWDNNGYFSALKNSLKGFFMTPFTQESYQSALQAGLQSIGKNQGVVRCHKSFLLCAQKYCERCRKEIRHLSTDQEVIA